MKQNKNMFEFTRLIKLPSALGDWTTIHAVEPEFEEINISSIQNINFDSLPKNLLKYVHYLHYRFAEKVARKLSFDMDIKVELHTISATQLAYQDFIKLQSGKVVQADFYIKEIGKVNMIFDWTLADMIVNRLVGGQGDASKREKFSELEGNILKTELRRLLPYYVMSWKAVFKEADVDMEFSSGDYIPDRKITLREAYVIFNIYLYFGKNDLKKITVAYPNHVLRRLLYMRKILHDPMKQRIKLNSQSLKDIKISVKAILGRAVVSMKELKTLQVGDVIALDTPLDQPLECVIGERTKLTAQPGISNQRLALQLLLWDEEKTPRYDLLHSLPVPSKLDEHGELTLQRSTTQQPVPRPAKTEKQPLKEPEEEFEEEASVFSQAPTSAFQSMSEPSGQTMPMPSSAGFTHDEEEDWEEEEVTPSAFGSESTEHFQDEDEEYDHEDTLSSSPQTAAAQTAETSDSQAEDEDFEDFNFNEEDDDDDFSWDDFDEDDDDTV